MNFDLSTFLAQIEKDLSDAIRLIDQLEEKLEQASYSLEKVKNTQKLNGSLSEGRQQLKLLLRSLAMPVAQMEIWRLPDNRARFVVDGNPPVIVPPRPADLLSIAADTSCGADGQLEWLPVTRAARILDSSEGALRNLISRVRWEVLFEANFNPFLLETVGEGEHAAFRLRTRSAIVHHHAAESNRQLCRR